MTRRRGPGQPPLSDDEPTVRTPAVRMTASQEAHGRAIIEREGLSGWGAMIRYLLDDDARREKRRR